MLAHNPKPFNVTPDTVHPSHDVREEDTMGYMSDPVCQKCRVAAYGSKNYLLLAPCKLLEGARD